jgi:hypothetical protein
MSAELGAPDRFGQQFLLTKAMSSLSMSCSCSSGTATIRFLALL